MFILGPIFLLGEERIELEERTTGALEGETKLHTERFYDPISGDAGTVIGIGHAQKEKL